MRHPLPVLLLLCALPSCSLLRGPMESLPKRDESFSYFGPGSERILKGAVPAFGFAEDSSRYDAGLGSNAEALETALDKLGEDTERQILLAGFATDSGTAEFNRVLGEERAQAVRQALLGKGGPAARIHTVSYGNEFDARQGNAGRRVEAGLVEAAQ